MISKSVQGTAAIAQEIARGLHVGTGADASATVFALSGDLGSGKTTFTKAFAAAFGVAEDDVTSPTFVIMKSYDIAASALGMAGGFKKLIHIDAYRLETPVQAAQIGWDALVADPANLILVEWPEKIGEKMPSTAQKITFRFVDENTREIDI